MNASQENRSFSTPYPDFLVLPSQAEFRIASTRILDCLLHGNAAFQSICYGKSDRLDPSTLFLKILSEIGSSKWVEPGFLAKKFCIIAGARVAPEEWKTITRRKKHEQIEIYFR